MSDRMDGYEPQDHGVAADAAALPPSGLSQSSLSQAKPAAANAVTRQDFPARPYGERAWEIHRDTGVHPFEALSMARDEEMGVYLHRPLRKRFLAWVKGW